MKVWGSRIAQLFAFFCICTCLHFAFVFDIVPGALRQNNRYKASRGIRVYVSPTNRSIIAGCAVPNVCMRKVVAYIPAKLRAHDALLRQCFMYNVKIEYYNPGGKEPRLRKALRHRLDIDVLGRAFVDPYAVHFGHFGPQASQMILPTASLFLPKHRALPEQCVSPQGKLEPCTTPVELRPRIVVGNIFMRNRWNRGFLKFLAENMQRPASKWWHFGLLDYFHSPSYLHTLTYNTKTLPTFCFQHALTSPLIHNASIEWQDRWLRSKGVKRDLHVHSAQSCSPRIVILLRDERRRLGRSVPKLIRIKLRKQLKRQLINVGIAPNIEVIIDLGRGRTFIQQMAVIQRADIVLAVHGAEFSNFLFLQTQAIVIELSPFGFFDPYFDKTVSMAGSTVHRLCLAPEREQFGKCLRQKSGNTSEAFAEFERMAKQYRLDPGDSGTCRLTNQLAFSCTRSQRAVFDPVRVASIVTQHAQTMCKRNQG